VSTATSHCDVHHMLGRAFAFKIGRNCRRRAACELICLTSSCRRAAARRQLHGAQRRVDGLGGRPHSPDVLPQHQDKCDAVGRPPTAGALEFHPWNRSRAPVCTLLLYTTASSLLGLASWAGDAKYCCHAHAGRSRQIVCVSLSTQKSLRAVQVSRAAQVAVPSPQPAPVVQTRTVVGAFSLLLAGVVATRLWAHWTGKKSKPLEPPGVTGVIMIGPELISVHS